MAFGNAKLRSKLGLDRCQVSKGRRPPERLVGDAKEGEAEVCDHVMVHVRVAGITHFLVFDVNFAQDQFSHFRKVSGGQGVSGQDYISPGYDGVQQRHLELGVFSKVSEGLKQTFDA